MSDFLLRLRQSKQMQWAMTYIASKLASIHEIGFKGSTP